MELSCPRVKPEHAPFRIEGGRIRIGGVSYGIAGEVADPAGSVWTLLTLMDGSRSVDEIVAAVIAGHPDEDAADVRDGIASLVESGYVEDAAAPAPAILSERDMARHDRGRRYLRWLDLTARASTWEPQALLKQADVAVVGVGGTGGHAAMALAAAGVGRLRLVDFDRVDLSNLNRQVLFTEADIGRPKLDAAANRLRAINTDIEITTRELRITGPEDLVPVAKEADALLMSADRPVDIRKWANRACLAAGTPWVDAGYHGPLVTFGVFTPGAGACYECVKKRQHEYWDGLGAVGDDAPQRGEAVAAAVAAPSAGISGYLAAHGVISLITGVPSLAAGHVYAVNLAAVDAPFAITDPADPDCPACGHP